MPQQATTLDLESLSLSYGEGRRVDLAVRLEPLAYGGQSYAVAPVPLPLAVEVSRTASGYALRMKATATLRGPCMRCLEPSENELEVESREVDEARSGDEELSSPYVAGGELDLVGWARDALALALPPKLLCRAGCAGLCPVCGISLNEVDRDSHRHDSAPDPRWSKLRDLKLE